MPYITCVAHRRKGMLELTGTGDDGSTGLLGGGRAPKNDPRIEAYGTVDEASSALGLAKGLSANLRVKEVCEELQRGLYRLGAELATNPTRKGTFATVGPQDLQGLERIAAELEEAAAMPDGFILPGATAASGALDLARAVVRRAERRCVSLGAEHRAAQVYLNRLSLVLFILGRYEEALAGVETKAARG
ncbi:MAG: cob(I)yrinic acid a,c-diamide adenosyltransferase [Candidatus Dormibacteraeota bacterium]|nr:cob(I)yrinic acid a,c-diamide adenosyltransferase [Candidatus Dormibacteraeota bacterium]